MAAPDPTGVRTALVHLRQLMDTINVVLDTHGFPEPVEGDRALVQDVAERCSAFEEKCWERSGDLMEAGVMI